MSRRVRRTALVVGVCALLGLGMLGLQALGRRPAVLRVQPVRLVADAPAAADAPTVASGRGTPRVSTTWVDRTATASGVPAPAVRAYGTATLRSAARDPGCHLGWTTLAGIGWIESQHGTLGDRTLEADGHSSTPIIGPALKHNAARLPHAQ